MSLIKNLVKNTEDKPRKGDETNDDEKKPRPTIKSATDLQRLKLEKLMKNPAKPVVIPESRRDKDYMNSVPSFVRNVMGSSAGAGSGEFHVYRHLRRKEYARQKTIQAKSVREELDEAYQKKLEENRLKAEEKTAKKRAKRLKRKQKAKKPRHQQNDKPPGSDRPDGEESSDDDENTDDDKDNDKDHNEADNPAQQSESANNKDAEDEKTQVPDEKALGPDEKALGPDEKALEPDGKAQDPDEKPRDDELEKPLVTVAESEAEPSSAHPLAEE